MWGLGLIARVLGSQKNIDHIASGASTIATMIDERNFTAEEKSKVNVKLVEHSLKFQELNNDQNSERSKTRRAIALLWIRFYLATVFVYIVSLFIGTKDESFVILAAACLEVIKLLGTGTLVILAFFFGTHLIRQGVGIAKGK